MQRSRTFSLLLGASLLLSGSALAATPESSGVPLPSAVKQAKSDAAWLNHYSVDWAVNLYAAGVWNPIKGHTPEETMNQGEFVDLLLKVTGTEIPVTTAYDRDKNLTRGLAAKWVQDLTRFNTGFVGGKPPFSDLTGTESIDSAIQYVYNTGIMSGDNKRFYPDDLLTRGQAAIVLNKVLSHMPQMAKQMAFEKLDENLPVTAHTVYQENKSEAGLYRVDDGDARYLIVAGGEQPTTGYSVTIDSIMEMKNAIYVRASFQRPGPDKMVGQMFTYPVAAAKIKDQTKPVFLLP